MIGPKFIKENLRKLRKLAPWERRVLLQAMFLLPTASLALRLASFKWCQSALTAQTEGGKKSGLLSAEKRAERARSMARLVRLAARRGLYRGANCLPQSLVLWWLLRRQEIESDLRIGVSKRAEQFEAHAWVELDGAALNESADLHERFKPFDGAVLPVHPKFQ